MVLDVAARAGRWTDALRAAAVVAVVVRGVRALRDAVADAARDVVGFDAVRDVVAARDVVDAGRVAVVVRDVVTLGRVAVGAVVVVRAATVAVRGVDELSDVCRVVRPVVVPVAVRATVLPSRTAALAP